MATAADSAPGLSFPHDTFAKLTPRPFLLAHLSRPQPIRPNGRTTHEFRKPTINTGSLTHSNGSAVVRIGDTAVVCSVRGEVLLASDIPNPPKEDASADSALEELGLVVPNLELSTGCSPAHLPGNPPASLAQSLSYRISSLLYDSGAIDVDNLRIEYTQPKTDDDVPDEGPSIVTKAYWTLYVDILCLALDGNALDADWLAVVAALQDTKLPRAWWDADREIILCSPLVSESSSLNLTGLPITANFAVFTTASPLKKREGAKNWVIADPDAFEEDICRETLTVTLTPLGERGRSILRIEKSGGTAIGKEVMKQCIADAEQRWVEVEAALRVR